MTRVHLLLGPVGAGKSTLARTLGRQHRALSLTLDEWMTVLFRDDRPASDLMPWYAERAQRCVEQIWRVTRAALAVDIDVILELGLVARRARADFYARLDAAGIDAVLHVLDAPREVRRQRVAQRNRQRGPTYAMTVPPAIFELASDLWEPILPEECAGRDVHFIDTADREPTPERSDAG